jgi:hypothetical protein
MESKGVFPLHSRHFHAVVLPVFSHESPWISGLFRISIRLYFKELQKSGSPGATSRHYWRKGNYYVCGAEINYLFRTAFTASKLCGMVDIEGVRGRVPARSAENPPHI